MKEIPSGSEDKPVSRIHITSGTKEIHVPIEWRDAMSVGNERIDADHKYLIELINHIEHSLIIEEDEEGVSKGLDGLLRYTHDHFKREEDLQRKVNYPSRNKHYRLHRDLITRLLHIQGKFVQGSHLVDQEDGKDLIKLLRDWLILHVLNDDLQMRPYFQMNVVQV